jgi:putative two-component system response regulator
LRGDQIPISARIVKVADVYDALSTDRPYRKKMTEEEVHAILRDGAGKHFDRLLVEIFLNRSLPSIEQHAGLRQLHRAVGTRPALAKVTKTVDV